MVGPAGQDRPEFRIATDDIDACHDEILARAPHALHPNGRVVTDKPWGLREFALRDPSGVCVIVDPAWDAIVPERTKYLMGVHEK